MGCYPGGFFVTIGLIVSSPRWLDDVQETSGDDRREGPTKCPHSPTPSRYLLPLRTARTCRDVVHQMANRLGISFVRVGLKFLIRVTPGGAVLGGGGQIFVKRTCRSTTRLYGPRPPCREEYYMKSKWIVCDVDISCYLSPARLWEHSYITERTFLSTTESVELFSKLRATKKQHKPWISTISKKFVSHCSVNPMSFLYK